MLERPGPSASIQSGNSECFEGPTINALLARALHTGAAVLTVAILSACTTISFDQPKSVSTAYSDTRDTKLGRALTKWNSEHTDKISGFLSPERWAGRPGSEIAAD